VSLIVAFNDEEPLSSGHVCGDALILLAKQSQVLLVAADLGVTGLKHGCASLMYYISQVAKGDPPIPGWPSQDDITKMTVDDRMPA
jgi:hypothetical protein